LGGCRGGVLVNKKTERGEGHRVRSLSLRRKKLYGIRSQEGGSKRGQPGAGGWRGKTQKKGFGKNQNQVPVRGRTSLVQENWGGKRERKGGQ